VTKDRPSCRDDAASGSLSPHSFGQHPAAHTRQNGPAKRASPGSVQQGRLQGLSRPNSPVAHSRDHIAAGQPPPSRCSALSLLLSSRKVARANARRRARSRHRRARALRPGQGRRSLRFRLALLSCFLLALTIVLPSRDRSRAAAHADREPRRYGDQAAATSTSRSPAGPRAQAPVRVAFRLIRDTTARHALAGCELDDRMPQGMRRSAGRRGPARVSAS